MKKYTAPRRQRGQALIIIAGALVALLALVALAVDGSNAFAQRRNAQNAADGAAAAGTNLLLSYYMNPVGGNPGGNRLCTDVQHPCQETALSATQDRRIFEAVQTTLASQAGIDTVAKNDGGTLWARYIDQDGHFWTGGDVGFAGSVPLAGGQGPGSAGVSGIWVQTTSSSPTFFARILGIENVTADANSSGQVGNPESAVWPPQSPDQSGNLPTLIVWPVTIIMNAVSFPQQDDNGNPITMDLYNFDNSTGPASFDVLNYAQTTDNQGCADGHWADMRCQILRGFNARFDDTPFKGYKDDQGGTRAGARLPDLHSMPIGSDGVTSGSRGVWVAADTDNRFFDAWSAVFQNALRFHWTMLMSISDNKDTTASTPKYRVVNMTGVKVLSGELCTQQNNNCSVGGTPLPNTAHFKVQFRPGEWNSGRGDVGSDPYKSIQNGQFVLTQGH